MQKWPKVDLAPLKAARGASCPHLTPISMHPVHIDTRISPDGLNYLENELGYEETIDIKALANAEPLAPSQLYFATDENIVKSNSQKRIHFSKGTNMNANRHCTDICVYSIISQCFAVQNSLSLQEMSLLL